jgi:Ca2+-binding EF-hand superfamily protein
MRHALTLVAGLALATSAFAMGETIDTDGDAKLSMDELLVAYPTLTEDAFKQMDTNADGSVDMDEFEAAVNAGQIEAPK